MSIMTTKQTIEPAGPQRDWDTLKVLVGGIVGMVIVMGIGRFAFTPILPLMQRDLGLSNTAAGWLAGLNYLGYLCGAVLCSIAPQIIRHRTAAAGALLMSIATTILMGLTLSELHWGVLRFGSGVASALLFIIITVETGEALARSNHSDWFGTLYGGIGLGIALSGIIVPQLDQLGGWDATWIGMGILAVVLAVAAAWLGKDQGHSAPRPAEYSGSSCKLSKIWLLVSAYFLEGFGYIITGTFIVTIIAKTPGLEGLAPYSWVTVGLAAIPSTILWPHLARRIGNKKALLAAYSIQAAGVLVSIQATSIVEVIIASVTFGGTFLGIVALTIGEGNFRTGRNSQRTAAILTASFGIGQMLGPIVAGVLADHQEGFDSALLLAAVSVIFGGILTALDKNFRIQS